MKVVCINDKPIHLPNGQISWGEGLKEGEEYNAERTERHWNGRMCYFITGLGLKQVQRFMIVDNWVNELIEQIQVEELVSA